MTLEEYQQFVVGVASEDAKATYRSGLLTAGLGLAGEAGEFADHVKKFAFHGRAFEPSKAVDELGDVLWYVAFGANAIGSSLEDVMLSNVEKLRKRYPRGFESSRAHDQGEQ